ncbi:MAG TPA: hypothetical protein VHK90_17885, partial [Thermoanaerobaculia bacterium]|nr:hypothetical protein [Thermoanaerobaculia bacterium]
MSYEEKLQALRAARTSRDEASADVYSLRVRQLSALRARRTGAADTSHTLEEIARQLPQSRETLLGRESLVGQLLDDLFLDTTPEQLIENWSDDKPILLLPLRVETKFRDGDNGIDLCVRIFP